jgi:hypothetical protein
MTPSQADISAPAGSGHDRVVEPDQEASEGSHFWGSLVPSRQCARVFVAMRKSLPGAWF